MTGPLYTPPNRAATITVSFARLTDTRARTDVTLTRARHCIVASKRQQTVLTHDTYAETPENNSIDFEDFEDFEDFPYARRRSGACGTRRTIRLARGAWACDFRTVSSHVRVWFRAGFGPAPPQSHSQIPRLRDPITDTAERFRTTTPLTNG